MSILKMSNMKKKKTGLSITAMYVLAACILIVISLSIYIPLQYSYANNKVSEYVTQVENSNLTQLKDRLNMSVEKMEQYLYSVANNKTLIQFLHNMSSDSLSLIDKKQLIQEINTYLVHARDPYDDIEFLNIVTPARVYSSEYLSVSTASELVPSYSSINRNEIYDIIRKSGNSAAFLPDQYIDGFAYNTSRFIIPVENNLIEPAYVVCEMRRDWLNNLLKTNKCNTYLYENGRLEPVFSSEPQISSLNQKISDAIIQQTDSFFENVDKTRYYNISCQKVYNTPFYIVSVQNMSDFIEPLNKMKKYAFYAIIISLAFSSICLILFTKKRVSDLKMLKDSAKEYVIDGVGDLLPLKYKLRSLNEVTTIYFFLIVSLSIITFSTIFCFLTAKIMKNSNDELISLSLEQTVGSIETFIKWNNEVSRIIAFDEVIQNILKDVNKGKGYDKEQIEQIISSKTMPLNIQSVELYDSQGNLFFSNSNKYRNQKMELSEEIQNSYGEMIFWEPDNVFDDSRQIRFIRKIKNIYVNDNMSLDNIGYIACVYNKDTLPNVLNGKSLNKTSDYVFNSKGDMIFTNSYDEKENEKINLQIRQMIENKSQIMLGKSNIINFKMKDNKQYIGFIKRFSNINWIAFSIISDKQFKLVYALLFSFNLNILLIFCAFILLISRLLANYLVRPINSLIENIINLDSCADIPDNKQIFYPNEVNELTYAFNKMILQVQHVYDLEAEKNKAEIKALQSQINPHFMYNTFESIRWMNKMGDIECVDNMIGYLSDLFRFGISEDKNLVTLKEEISYTKAYLNIQKIRYGDQLNFDWHIEENALDFIIPKLILQPLIENSICHGIRELVDTAGFINIYCSLSGNALTMKICDNGPGMPKQRLEELNQSFILPNNAEIKGIGLKNVYHRLSYYYKSNFKMAIESQPFINTEITITIMP